ncbi:MAG: hypothetical protein J5J00_10275 [Deltaproteobacteria bacterium]|nr:hypothetical protein [Deltaproteobacteria bacterium]
MPAHLHRAVRRVCVLLLILFAASGCGSVPVAEDLSQKQANEIVALLTSHGMASYSRKEGSSAATFSVQVKRSSYSEAVQLMAAKGLPSEPRPSFEEFVAAKGILPNSREFEAVRLDHALAMELEDLIASHPAVASVRAVVRVHAQGTEGQGGVSLVIQQRKGLDLSAEETKRLVMQSIPGVKSEQITLSIQTVTDLAPVAGSIGVVNSEGAVTTVPLVPFIFNWRVPEDDYAAMVIVIVLCAGVIAVIGGLVGYWFGLYSGAKHIHEGALPELGIKSLRLDRPNRDMPEV